MEDTKKQKKKTKKKESKSDQLQKQLDEAKEQLLSQAESLKAAEERSLRALAELENFKKRKEQEKSDFIKFSNEKYVQDLLPIIDAFDLALSQVNQSESKEKDPLQEGFNLIYKQFSGLLEKMNVQKMDALDQPFDPNLHQAVSQEEKEGVAADTIIRVFQAGYSLNGRVIRPAMVVVSK